MDSFQDRWEADDLFKADIKAVLPVTLIYCLLLAQFEFEFDTPALGRPPPSNSTQVP